MSPQKNNTACRRKGSRPTVQDNNYNNSFNEFIESCSVISNFVDVGQEAEQVISLDFFEF